MKILLILLAVLMLPACGNTIDPIPENSASSESAVGETGTMLPETGSDRTEEPETNTAAYRELRFTAKDGYQSPMLIRITSAEERKAVYEILLKTAYLDEAYDYTNGYDRNLFTGWLSLTERYDDAWFETHDLYIAVTGEDSSTPRYSAAITEDGQLEISATHHELISDDLIGRHILAETEKGRELTWSRTDGVCYTADTLPNAN